VREVTEAKGSDASGGVVADGGHRDQRNRVSFPFFPICSVFFCFFFYRVRFANCGSLYFKLTSNDRKKRGEYEAVVNIPRVKKQKKRRAAPQKQPEKNASTYGEARADARPAAAPAVANIVKSCVDAAPRS
jgi:hypothetical protein